MQRLKDWTDAMRQARHPGVALGEFLIGHTNSPSYLVGILRSALKVAEQELADEQAIRSAVLATYAAENERGKGGDKPC